MMMLEVGEVFEVRKWLEMMSIRTEQNRIEHRRVGIVKLTNLLSYPFHRLSLAKF